MCFPHTTRSSQTAIPPCCSRNPPKDPSDPIVHRASEPSLSNRWGVIHSTRVNNNSRSDKSAEQRDARSIRRQTSHHTRPETHQNLIHSNKEQHDRSTGTADTNGATTPPGRFAQAHDQTEFEHPRYRPKSASLLDLTVPRPATALIICFANDCRRERTVGLLAAFALQMRVVETIGIEPMTPCLQSRCSPS